MSGSRKRPRGLRRVALLTTCAAVVAGALWAVRGPGLAWVSAQQPAAPPPAVFPGGPQAGAPANGVQAPAAAAPGRLDYVERVVAYVHDNQPVTRQELGEYLIARHGAEKLPLLLNKKIVEAACRARGIEVTAADVDTSLAESLKQQKLDLNTFVKNILPRYKKNLTEWKEDVLRPRLMMTRLCQGQVVVSEEEINKAFEATYGEKTEGRMIIWPLEQEAEALAEYNKLRDSEDAFVHRARNQARSELSATGGKIRPVGRYALGDEKLERAVFAVAQGQVSELVHVKDGVVLYKCDHRHPADTTVNREAVRARLIKDLADNKVGDRINVELEKLKKQAQPQAGLKKGDRPQPGAPLPPPTQVIGYVYGTMGVTREELGEYLIARYGPDAVELLVNHRVIDQACAVRGIQVSDAEIDQELKTDLDHIKMDQATFEKEMLGKWNKTIYEWREDVVRPKLQLTKLARERVSVSEDDLRKAFAANYGEKVEVRMILWPADQTKFALQEYPVLRDSEEAFARKAQNQATPSLAAHGGRLPEPLGHHSLGDEDLEREMFQLQPGQVSTLIGTPQGQVLLKCDRRIPPDPSIKLEQVRAELHKLVFERKVQAETQTLFRDLKEKAHPRLMLRDGGRPEDLLAETSKILDTLPPEPPGLAGKEP